MRFFNFFLFVFVSVAFGGFYINQIEVGFYVNEDGTANAVEKYNVVIEGSNDLGKYIKTMESNSLSDWANLLGEEFRIHVNQLYLGVSNLSISPQPPKAPTFNKSSAVVYIFYNVVPREKGKEALFFVEKVRPRLFKYELNKEALSFNRTALGNMVLDSKTSLVFYLPENSFVVRVNPEPYFIDERKVMWRNTILVNYELIFYRKISIYEEVSLTFNRYVNAFLDFLSTERGKVAVMLLFILIVFYFYLYAKKEGVV